MTSFNQQTVCNSSKDDGEISEALWPAYNIIFPLIIISGIGGNVMNLLVLSRPILRGVTYLYLSGLAVTDFGVMLCAVPAVIRFNKHKSLPYARAFFHAHLELVLTNTFMATSVFIVCFMTVDRYFSICKPTQFKSIHTKKNAMVAISFSYSLGFLISCPLCLLKITCMEEHANLYGFQENKITTDAIAWKIYLWICEPGMRLLPALILLVLNSLIIFEFRKLAKHQRRIYQDLNKIRRRLDTSERQSVVRYKLYLEEQRLVNLLTSIIVTFILTMTPATLLSVLYSEHLDNDWAFQVFRAVANILEVSNFALNFFIYCLCSRQFRKGLLSFFHLDKKMSKSLSAIEMDITKNGTSCSH